MLSYGNEKTTGVTLLTGNNASKMRNPLTGPLSSSNASSLSAFSMDASILESRPTITVPGMYMEETTEDILDKLEQAGRVPSKEKFRRMACNTFIYTGACPYNDRCVFLHDYRIKTEGAKVRTTRQTKINSAIKDTFYWPDMVRKDVIKHLDAQGLPTANQMYVIPESFKHNPHNFHNRGLYSMWTHFVEFCIHNNVLTSKKGWDLSQEPFFDMSNYRDNPHVPQAKRLTVFIHLSMTKTESRSSSKQKSLSDIVATAQEVATATQTSRFLLSNDEVRIGETNRRPPMVNAPLSLSSNSSTSIIPHSEDDPSRYTRSHNKTINGPPLSQNVMKTHPYISMDIPSTGKISTPHHQHSFFNFDVRDDLELVDDFEQNQGYSDHQNTFDEEENFIPPKHRNKNENEFQLDPIQTESLFENDLEEDNENDTGTQMWMSMKGNLSGTFSLWSPLPPDSRNQQEAFDEIDDLIDYDTQHGHPSMNTLVSTCSDLPRTPSEKYNHKQYMDQPTHDGPVKSHGFNTTMIPQTSHSMHPKQETDPSAFLFPRTQIKPSSDISQLLNHQSLEH